jgi:mannose-6-phosphate isomerase-like protein (cupin superfamily)
LQRGFIRLVARQRGRVLRTPSPQKGNNMGIIRKWGHYSVLHESQAGKTKTKVKTLTINPHSKLSDQLHHHRNEYWYIISGNLIVTIQEHWRRGGDYLENNHLKPHDTLLIKKDQWHLTSNPYNEPCVVLETQYGESCEEEDIQRRQLIPHEEGMTMTCTECNGTEIILYDKPVVDFINGGWLEEERQNCTACMDGKIPIPEEFLIEADNGDFYVKENIK